jgi:sensor histidine kinase regulating citrate/malate metabolism
MHGIGISSIRNAVSRYGGSVSVKVDNDNKLFALVVMLPFDNAPDNS